MNAARTFSFTSLLIIGFFALLLLVTLVTTEQASAESGISLSVRVSNEINCEAEPQTNIYFDIVPPEGGEVAVNDGGLVRKFDAIGSYEEGGLNGYFGNGTYQGTLSPKAGYVLAQSSAFSFVVGSQCDANGIPILSASSTGTTTTTTTTPPPATTEPSLAPANTSEPAPTTQATTINIPPSITSCGSEKECAQLCTKGAGANACADFATQMVVPFPLSSVSTEATGNATLEAAVNTFFEERSGARAFTDTDKDGITDFDEVNIYGTDPKRADSDKDGVPDGAELIANTNPVRGGAAIVTFEDPNTHGKTASATLTVATIIPGATTTDADGTKHLSSMTLSGHAPANSFITIFVYSEPIVATIKTDESGSWTYTLDKELPDGSHEVFAAVTDSGGRVLAKSNPLPFVKEAAAVSFGASLSLPQSPEAPSFFGTNSIIILPILLVVILGIVIFVFGMIARRDKGDGTGTPTA